MFYPTLHFKHSYNFQKLQHFSTDSNFFKTITKKQRIFILNDKQEKKLKIKSMINIDCCDSNNSYKKQVPMTASFLEGSSTTNRNKKLKIKSMINIDYRDSNYSYKKQAPKQHCFRGLINDKQEQEINY